MRFSIRLWSIWALLSLAPFGLAAQQARTITLDDAMKIALRQNGDLRLARNAAAQEMTGVRQARSAFLPNLSFSTSTGQNYGRNFSLDEGRIVNQTTQSFNMGVSSSVTLFNGFQNTSNARSASLSEEASEQSVRRAEQTVAFTVATNFVNLVTQQELLRVQEQNLVAQEAQENQIRQFVDAGTRPISDLYQQQAAVASTRLAVVNAQRALELAKVDIIQALQLDPTGVYEFVAATTTEAADTSATFEIESLLQSALLKRADISARQLAVDAASVDVKAAQGTRWPTLSLSAGYNTAFSSASDMGFSDQLDQRRGGSLGLSVQLPLFDRNSSSINSQRARIAEENARIALQNQRQQVALEVRRALLDYNAAQQQLAAAEAQERAASLALESTSRRYDVGAATLLEVTQARATMVQAASSLVNARNGLTLQRSVMSYYTGDLETTAWSD